MPALNIRHDSCALDFLSLGALIHRLDPGVIPFRKARTVDIHVSGGEYNVAANLSDAFGLKTGDFDWPAIFAGGVRWFHSGGIFAALSETTSELILDGMQAAKAAGAAVSFDLNYRAKLWASVGGADRARKVLRRIAGQVDAL